MNTHSPQVIEWDLGELTAESAAFTTPHIADMAINHPGISLNVLDWYDVNYPLFILNDLDDTAHGEEVMKLINGVGGDKGDVDKGLVWIAEMKSQMDAIKTNANSDLKMKDLIGEDTSGEFAYAALRTYAQIPLATFELQGVVYNLLPFAFIQIMTTMIDEYHDGDLRTTQDALSRMLLTVTEDATFQQYEVAMAYLKYAMETARDAQMKRNATHRVNHIKLAVKTFFTGGEYRESEVRNSANYNKFSNAGNPKTTGYSWLGAIKDGTKVATIRVYDPSTNLLSMNPYNFNVGSTDTGAELNHTFKTYIQQNLIDGSVAAGQAVKHDIANQELLKEMRKIMNARLSLNNVPDFLGTVELEEHHKFVLKFCLTVVTNGYSKKDSTTCFAMEFAVQNVEASMATALSVVGQTTGFKAIDTKYVQFNFPFRYKKQDPVIMYS